MVDKFRLIGLGLYHLPSHAPNAFIFLPRKFCVMFSWTSHHRAVSSLIDFRRTGCTDGVGKSLLNTFNHQLWIVYIGENDGDININQLVSSLKAYFVIEGVELGTAELIVFGF